MKTQILKVEPYDDLVSILDKISWAQTERILLVFPRRKKILRNKFELVRIQRYTFQRGCQLALVTSDPWIRTLAKEIELPTYPSIQKAHREEWPTKRASYPGELISPKLSRPSLDLQIQTLQKLRLSARPKLPLGVRLVWFLFGILAVGSLLIALTPRATVRIQPETQTQRMVIPILATERVDRARISGEIPISNLRITVAGKKTIKTTGSIILPKDFAQGEVVLTNLTDQPLEVPAGTVVRTADSTPRRYATQYAVRLQTGSAKQAAVPIQALEAGESQNAEAKEIKAVEGWLGLKVSVENPYPIRGGSDIIAPAPSLRDRQSLFEQLRLELIERAKAQAITALHQGDLLLPDSALKIQVNQQQYTPSEPIAAESLALELELAVLFSIVSHSTLADFANQVLDSTLPAGYLALEETLSATCREGFLQTESGDYRCSLEIARQIQPNIDAEQVRSLLVGKPLRIGLHRLQDTYRLSETPRIEIFPRWLPIFPLLPMRLEILVER